MRVNQQLERYRKEHDGILRFLSEWESALKLAASEEEAERRQGLEQLRLMDAAILKIRSHCEDEERNLDSPFQLHLDEDALEHLRQEHELLEQLTHGFRSELKWLTTPPVATDLVARGQTLLEHLRHHIAFEEGLLKQIEDGAAKEPSFAANSKQASGITED
jgi:hemerythrin-like domain-containing protein